MNTLKPGEAAHDRPLAIAVARCISAREEVLRILRSLGADDATARHTMRIMLDERTYE